MILSPALFVLNVILIQIDRVFGYALLHGYLRCLVRQLVKKLELERDGSNLIYNLFISVPQAILGTEAEVPTVSGKVRVKIAPGTQSGKILRLRGKGLPVVNGYGNGDLLVYVNVWIPKKVTKDEEKVLQGLVNSESFKPAPNEDDRSFFKRLRDYFS